MNDKLITKKRLNNKKIKTHPSSERFSFPRASLRTSQRNTSNILDFFWKRKKNQTVLLMGMFSLIFLRKKKKIIFQCQFHFKTKFQIKTFIQFLKNKKLIQEQAFSSKGWCNIQQNFITSSGEQVNSTTQTETSKQFHNNGKKSNSLQCHKL